MSKTVAVLLAFIFSMPALASLPADEPSHQMVRAVHVGSALIVEIASANLRKNVIGYKISGELGADRPESLQAIVIARCGNSEVATRVVNMGREWFGTGYITEPMDFRGLYPSTCVMSEENPIQLAFTDGKGKFDDGSPQAITITPNAFAATKSCLDTQEDGLTINMRAWEFIISEMRK